MNASDSKFDGPTLVGAIDLGASSGRVMAGVFANGSLELHEIHRFANGPVQKGDSLFWGLDDVLANLQIGLRKLGEFAEQLGVPVASIGVDTWAVDYGLIDAAGNLLGQPHHYRDQRNLLGVASVDAVVDPSELFAQNGLQFQPFNTLYQLAAEKLQRPELLAKTHKVLLVPDLIAHWLTGKLQTERTNASTTGLLNAETQEWNLPLMERLGLKPDWFAPLASPGATLGKLLPERVAHPALAETLVTTVASHDTAAAVQAAPLTDSNSAFLSSGTWSLLGLELSQPILSAAARSANFTNESGTPGNVRFLKNLSGLWLLQQTLDNYQGTDAKSSLADLLALAAKVESPARIDVNDPEFVAPGDMTSRIHTHALRAGHAVGGTLAHTVRCIMDSLADAYIDALVELQKITGVKVSQINVVGGGSQNQLLCQLTADRTGLPVVAGPVEATAIGNLIGQAAALGVLESDALAQRNFVARNFAVKTYQPLQNQVSTN